MRTVQGKLQAQIDQLDQILWLHARTVHPLDRDALWHETANEALERRSSLRAQQDAGFMITDKRKVRG